MTADNPQIDLEFIEAKGFGFSVYRALIASYARRIAQDTMEIWRLYQQLYGMPNGAILFLKRQPITRFDRLLPARSMLPGRIVPLDSYQVCKARRQLAWAVCFNRFQESPK